MATVETFDRRKLQSQGLPSSGNCGNLQYRITAIAEVTVTVKTFLEHFCSRWVQGGSVSLTRRSLWLQGSWQYAGKQDCIHWVGGDCEYI